MKPLLITFALTCALSSFGQQSAPVTLWTNANTHGSAQALRLEEGKDHLRPEMFGQVSALAVAAGYTVTLFDGEDQEGRDTRELHGPCRIDDLKTLLRLHGNGNWDNAIGSLLVEVSAGGTLPRQPAELASEGSAIEQH